MGFPDHTWDLADRIYTPFMDVFAGGAGFESQQQQSFLHFVVNFFPRASSY
jgi:hypothetical protein